MRNFIKLKECHKDALAKFVDGIEIWADELDTYTSSGEGCASEEDYDWREKYARQLEQAIELIKADGIANYVDCADEDADDIDEADWFTIDNEAVLYLASLLGGNEYARI